MKIDLTHRQSAHCESGTIANLLRFHGITLSEPMIFGLGSGLFFTYLPFIKVNGAPAISFRTYPGGIVKRLMRQLGISLKFKKFRDPENAMQALDRSLEKGALTGLVTGVFHLPYFPPEYRFHFNAHHILVFGKENGDYLVSDPVMQKTETIAAKDLRKARFAKGPLSPNGKMYTITECYKGFDLKELIVKAIRKTCREMLFTPLPICGVRGIRLLAKKVRKWPAKLDSAMARLYLGQIIRMSEEIGTGGAGFRFIYAAFLQESAQILGYDWLKDMSIKMTDVGDKWREFSYLAAKNFKRNRKIEAGSYDVLSDRLLKIADREKDIYHQLRACLKTEPITAFTS
jgi:hypothetical protein